MGEKSKSVASQLSCLSAALLLMLSLVFTGTVSAFADGGEVAKVGGSTYGSLAEAVSAAQPGDTVELLTDTTVTEGIVINKKVSLILGDKTISYAPTYSKAAYVALFSIEEQGELSIEGGRIEGPTGDTAAGYDGKVMIDVDGGKLFYKSGTMTAGGRGSDGMYGIYVLRGGVVELGLPADVQAGTGASGPEITTWFAAIGTNNTTAPATVTIHGGFYTALASPQNDSTWWAYFAAPVYAAANGTYELKGGTFTGYYGLSSRYLDTAQDITIADVSFNTQSKQLFIDNRKGSTDTPDRHIKSTSSALSLPDGLSWFITATPGVYEAGTAVARITKGDPATEHLFASLAEAVLAAESGDTVELLTDTTAKVVVENKSIQLDLGGHTLTAVATWGLETKGSAELTLKNGTIASGSGGVAVRDNSLCTVTEGVKIDAPSWGVYAADTSTLNVEGGEIYSVLALSTNGRKGQAATINVYGGSVVGNKTDSDNFSAGVYLPSGTLNVFNGTIVGNEAAIMEIEDENNFNAKTYSSAPKSVYYKKKGKERRDSADIDGDEDDLDKNDKNKEDEIEENEQNEIEERINKVNEDYFHLKYEMRYFV